MSLEGITKFGEWFANKDWSGILDEPSPSRKVELLHIKFNKGLKACFSYKYRKRKSTEPVWMTEEIKGLIRKRRHIFRKNKRKGRWQEMKKITEENCVDCVREKIVNQKDSRSFHKSVSSILKGCKQQIWEVRLIFDGLDDLQIAERLAGFFNGISQEYTPLSHDEIPVTVDSSPFRLTAEQVELKLRKCKKPTSTVPGDLPPALYDHFSGLLALVITNMFNSVLARYEWPALWTTEYVTVIPKGTNADSLDRCIEIFHVRITCQKCWRTLCLNVSDLRLR